MPPQPCKICVPNTVEQLALDHKQIDQLLTEFFCQAQKFFANQQTKNAASDIKDLKVSSVNISDGIGASAALTSFLENFAERLSGSSGPNYFGFVTGGATPASLLGDWLTAMFDQNAMGSKDSIAPHIEAQALSLFKQLIDLPGSFDGTFVTGATMSSFVGLATARQWVGEQHGLNIAQSGMFSVPLIKTFSATPHSSIYKAMSMAGLGRDNLTLVDALENREAIDVASLRRRLLEHNAPCIVVANSGTVNTVDFDDLRAIQKLKSEVPFWLHVDAAFGGIAACVKEYSHFCDGLDIADSITIDAHKWLNVPYDCAVQLTRHLPTQRRVFQNSAAYLEADISPTNFVDLTPENSRRLRALSVWMTLTAYGKNGYAEIVQRNVECAKRFGELISNDSRFELLAPVRLNGVCFTLANEPEGIGGSKALKQRISRLTHAIHVDGTFFLTPTVYQARPAMRLSVSNWQTQLINVEACYQKIADLVEATL